MATITQIRGALLEEAVLFLLNKIGYDTIDLKGVPRRDNEQMRSGHSGLEVRGRGTWHQIDAFAIWRHSPAFMYPLKLIVEAKCYNARRPVGVEVPRNVIGVLKDISENYFTLRRRQSRFHAPRYNYAAAIFSTSGFTSGAIEYALAHQVFLIQYENVPAIQPLIDAIQSFDEDCLVTTGREAISAARGVLRAWLNDLELDQEHQYALSQRGIQLLRGSVAVACRNIRGSYFGMLQGRWPLHLLMDKPLPSAAFEQDSISCKVLGNQRGEWRFVPMYARPEDEEWFELEFSLPPLVAELVEQNWSDPIAVAAAKQRHFSYIDLSGVIGGIRRNIRLELDRDWLRRYLGRGNL